MLEKIKNFVKEEEGASMVEYAVLIGIITAATILIIGTLGGQIRDAFQTVSDNIAAPVDP